MCPQVTDRFADSLEKAMVDRMTMVEAAACPAVCELVRLAYRPYQPYVTEYCKLESHFLKQKLASIQLVSPLPLPDTETVCELLYADIFVFVTGGQALY